MGKCFVVMCPFRVSSFMMGVGAASNYQYGVRASLKLQKFPSPRSHRPDGKIADVLASTHACTTENASVNYSKYVPQRPRKLPMAPMGCLADIPTSTLVLDDGCCLDLPVWGACHLHLKLQKFPSPPRETHVWLVVCRVAVFTSIPAQSQSSTPKCIPIKLPSCVLKIPKALMW